uniref:Uncharacterized protein n=1 Tax=Nicotiana tabacum TaxID=4097 RepID=A0A1S4B5X5_TOBAC|nr:PREDICTED: uncharacterized protein LOC107804779 [Nicotiana tabacum]
MRSELLPQPVEVSMPVGDSIVANHVYRGCIVLINDRPTSVDLVELVMLDFDAIMGMDWLAACYANIDCRAKLVRFHFPGEPVLEWKGNAATPKAFLGHVITSDSIKVDGQRIEAVMTWPRTLNPTEVHSFLGLARYYRSRKSMGSLSHVEADKVKMTKYLCQLANLQVRLVDAEGGRILVQNTTKSSFVTEVKERQHEDLELIKLRESIPQQRQPLFELTRDGVLRYQGRLCVPTVRELRVKILSEAHYSRYAVHPRETKMYQDLRQIYWCNGMKKDIAEMATQCPNCQKVKAEHQRPGGLTQCIELPLWKWDTINMDFITGLPRTPRRTTYSAKDYAKLYIREIVRLHEGVMRFGKKGKLSPRYVGLYKIILRIGRVAYELDLPSELGAVHPVFHVSMLRKCIGDPSCITPIEDIHIAEDLSYVEVPIVVLDRQVRKLRTKEVASVKVLWRNNNIEEMTWEAEEEMRKKYPYLFTT